jgi:hypothetical protein
MNDYQEHFVIYSDSSRAGYGGLKPKVMITTTKTMIEAASWELMKSNQCFEDLVGIPMIEIDGDLEYTRAITDVEVFNLSIEKLGDDGRLYDIYATNKIGAKEFIANADNYGLAEEAKELVKSFFGE